MLMHLFPILGVQILTHERLSSSFSLFAHPLLPYCFWASLSLASHLLSRRWGMQDAYIAYRYTRCVIFFIVIYSVLTPHGIPAKLGISFEPNFRPIAYAKPSDSDSESPFILPLPPSLFSLTRRCQIPGLGNRCSQEYTPHSPNTFRPFHVDFVRQKHVLGSPWLPKIIGYCRNFPRAEEDLGPLR
ncbi:hypothetical protein BDQ17DRAFT_687077 [Cyathus striatus]|nr:hypothetical protein BDQ17DRAFT_687077 [Cyathus striatus]